MKMLVKSKEVHKETVGTSKDVERLRGEQLGVGCLNGITFVGSIQWCCGCYESK